VVKPIKDPPEASNWSIVAEAAVRVSIVASDISIELAVTELRSDRVPPLAKRRPTVALLEVSVDVVRELIFAKAERRVPRPDTEPPLAIKF